MSDLDKTLVPPEDDEVVAKQAPGPEVITSPQPAATAPPPAAAGPSGTVLGDELEPLPASTVVGDDLAAQPTRQRPALVEPPTTAMPSAPEPARRAPVVELGLAAVLLLVGAVVWGVSSSDVEPRPPPQPIARAAPPPAPAPPKPPAPPAPRPPEKTVERTGPVVLPSKPPPPGKVKVFSEPTAHVFVDGRDFGKEPVTLKLPAGRNTLVLENPELPLRRVVTIEVKPAGATEERFTFAKGWLRVAAPREAKVRVDGKLLTWRELEVWEGNHRVDIIHADKAGTHESQVAVVKAGEITGVYFEPPRPKAR